MADSAEERTAGSSGADECLLSSKEMSQKENPSTKVPNNDPESKYVVPMILATDVSSCQGQENAGSSGKRKHSRWDVCQTGDQGIDDGVSMTKQRKTRWDDDDSQLKMLRPIHLSDFNGSANTAKYPQLQHLSEQSSDINCKLTYLNSIDKLPTESPPCQKLIKEKQKIIGELVCKSPTFDAPDLKQQKFFKKLYIPVQEYPGYNFVGLLLGPRGRSKKRMEIQTGAKIRLRGKGAFIKKDRIRDPSDDDEDLHVLVEATAQSSLDAAVAMVEELFVPVEDERNELKQAQLKELAKLKDKLRSKAKMSSEADGICKICRDLGHYTVACPLRAPLPEIKIDENCVLCETCGDAGHLAVACPFYATLLKAKTNNGTVQPALGDGFSQSTKPFPGSQPLDFRPATSSVPFGFDKSNRGVDKAKTNNDTVQPALGGGLSQSTKPFPGSQPLDFRPAMSFVPFGFDKSNRGVDCTSLYVDHIPQNVDVDRLVQLFSSFGALSQVKVIRDEGTGLSRRYGFVKYIDPTSAALAMNQMDGYRLDGNTLVVRVAGHQHDTPGSMQPVRHTSFCFRPAYPSSSAASHITAPTCWSGPPGTVLPETYNQMYTSYGSSYTSPVPSSQTSTLNGTSEELARFPGNPDSFASGYHLRTSALNATSEELARFPSNPGSSASRYQSRTSTLNATSEELARFPGNPDNLASGHRSVFS